MAKKLREEQVDQTAIEHMVWRELGEVAIEHSFEINLDSLKSRIESKNPDLKNLTIEELISALRNILRYCKGQRNVSLVKNGDSNNYTVILSIVILPTLDNYFRNLDDY